MNLTDSVAAIEALRRAEKTGDPEEVAHAAMLNIWPLYSAHFDDLTSAVEALPSSLLERFPVLRILHRMTPVLARTSHPFKPLVFPDDARRMSADELDVLTLVQMVAFRLSGDVSAAMIYARRMQDRIQQIRVESRERTDGPLWFYHQQIGSTLLAAGDSSHALLEFGTALEMGRLSPQIDAERMALGRTALTHAVRGSLDDAEGALAEAVRRPESTDAHLNATVATERAARALIGVEKMAENVEELLGVLESYDSIELTWPFALLARGRYLLAQDRPDEAMEAISLARDAHPDQHGSFASDVVNSLSIEALWTVGDTGTARRLAESTAGSGPLTRFAIVRHALLESRLDVADQGLRNLAAERSLGPGPRAEWTLLSASLESARTGGIAADTALQVARLAPKVGMRRLMSTMPTQLIGQVRAHLDPLDTATFDVAVIGLTSIDRPRAPVLTPSELRVLNALTKYPTTAEIAAALFVSPNTIKSQLRSLYRKLGCSARDEAIAVGARHHLLTVEIVHRS